MGSQASVFDASPSSYLLLIAALLWFCLRRLIEPFSTLYDALILSLKGGQIVSVYSERVPGLPEHDCTRKGTCTSFILKPHHSQNTGSKTLKVLLPVAESAASENQK